MWKNAILFIGVIIAVSFAFLLSFPQARNAIMANYLTPEELQQQQPGLEAYGSAAYSIGNADRNISYGLVTSQNETNTSIVYTPSCLTECHLPLRISYGGRRAPQDTVIDISDTAKISYYIAKSIDDSIEITDIRYLTTMNRTDYVPYDILKNATIPKWSNSTEMPFGCTAFNSTHYMCEYVEYNGTRPVNVTFNAWVSLIGNPMTIAKDSYYYIDFVGRRKPSIGMHSSDIVPSILGFNMTQFAWWGSSWSAKMNVTGISCNNLQYCTIKLNLTSSDISMAKVNADCSDIRIVNGTENDNLSYFVDYCDTSNGFIKVYFNNTNFSTVWIYYDNPSATANDNPQGVFNIKYDDAESNSTWTIASGHNLLQNSEHIGGTYSLNWSKGATTYAATRIAIASQSSGYVAVDFWFNDKPSSASFNNMYFAQSNQAVNSYNGFEAPRMLKNLSYGYEDSGGEKWLGVYSPNVWNDQLSILNFTVASYTGNMYLNGTLMVSQAAFRASNPVTYFGMGIDSAVDSVLIDNIKIYTMPNPPFPEPVYGDEFILLSVKNITFNATSGVQNDVFSIFAEIDGSDIDTVNLSIRKPDGSITNVTTARVNKTNETADLESGTITKSGAAATRAFYNTSTTTTNKAYYGDAGAQPPTYDNALLILTSAAAACYTNASTSNDVYCRAIGAGNPALRFDFTIQQDRTAIQWLNTSVEFKSTNNGGANEDCSADYINWASSGLTAIGADSTAEVTVTANTTSPTDYINSASNNVTVVVSGRALDAGESCDVDFIQLEAYIPGETEATSSNTSYDNVFVETTPINISMINVTVTVSANSSSGSQGVNKLPDLHLWAFNGTHWKNEGYFGFNTTNPMGTKTITITDGNILATWLTAANRDLRIEAVNLDGGDSISWNAVTVGMNYTTDVNWTYKWTDTSASGTYNVTETFVNSTDGTSSITIWTGKSFTIAAGFMAINATIEYPTNTTYTYSSFPQTIDLDWVCRISGLTIDNSWYRLNASSNTSIGTSCANTTFTGYEGWNNITVGINATDGTFNQSAIVFFTLKLQTDTCTPTNGTNWLLTCSDNCDIKGMSYSLLGITTSGTGTISIESSTIQFTSFANVPTCTWRFNGTYIFRKS